MKRVNCDSKPLAIEAVGNGSYFYRWDIEEVTTTDSETEEVRSSWDCYQVKISKTLSENNITEAVIDALWGNGEEQNLINDYNAYQLGVIGVESGSAYTAFLTERDQVKSDIKAACIEFGITAQSTTTLESAIEAKLCEIAIYDKSSEVNTFYVGDSALWVTREERSSLFFSSTLEKEAGATTSTLYSGASEYTYPVDDMLAMLASVELYAKNCYKVTQQHILSVGALTTIAEVEAYDITANYPTKLTF